MRKIKSFNNFKINESSETGDIELYRLVCVGKGEKLVVDTENPGKYYFKNEEDVNTDVLNKKGNEYHIITVVTDMSNIDHTASADESEEHGCECIVLNDETKATIKKIEPLED